MPGRVATELCVAHHELLELSSCGTGQLGLAVVPPKQKEQSSVEGAETKAGAVKAQRWPTVGQS